ncbi:MAG: helix-turn-helix domain-containing protein [Clostridiales bacterium]|jgi:predicted ArsR family transcriptional regulator|nr:helix-turn-helix domain-containing protein [Clostridiales bacterium]
MNNLSEFESCGRVNATVTGKLLYLILDGLTNQDGEVIISLKKISDTLDISKSAIRRNLRWLEHAGAIYIVPTYHRDGGRAANKYIVK